MARVTRRCRPGPLGAAPRLTWAGAGGTWRRCARSGSFQAASRQLPGSFRAASGQLPGSERAGGKQISGAPAQSGVKRSSGLIGELPARSPRTCTRRPALGTQPQGSARPHSRPPAAGEHPQRERHLPLARVASLHDPNGSSPSLRRPAMRQRLDIAPPKGGVPSTLFSAAPATEASRPMAGWTPLRHDPGLSTLCKEPSCSSYPVPDLV